MTDAPPLRFKRLFIEQLFGPGSSDIDIPFNLDQRVTVLHGRNGSGKTITLGLIEALRNENFAEFLRYPFKKFTLELSDGTSLTLERASTDESETESEGEGFRRLRYTIRYGDGSRIAAEMMIGSEKAATLVDDSRTEAWDVWRRGLKANGLVHLLMETPPAPEKSALSSLLGRLSVVKFIRADRLYVRDAHKVKGKSPADRARTALMVERLSQDIRELVVQADREYRLVSTRLDSSLPNRLFERHKDIPSLKELRARSKSLREQAARLKELGLLREEPDVLNEAALNDEQKGTFFIILKDREEKLRPFTAVLDKAQRLLQSLNRKLAPKRVRLDVETGYQVLTAAGTPLPLECLSSGEQHELVLLHELLFDVQPGSLILIDEPELSLHPTWQVDVLPDLLDIAKLSDLDFVLATHSPYIVKDHDDLMVRLGEPV